MPSVTDPPEEVFCLGYTWEQGNASGGTRELFLSKSDVEYRISRLISEKEDRKLKGNLTVHQLFEGQWRSIQFVMPQDFRLVGL